jgi:hypothetical protein
LKWPLFPIAPNLADAFSRNPANGGTSGPQAYFFAEKAIAKVGKGY